MPTCRLRPCPAGSSPLGPRDSAACGHRGHHGLRAAPSFIARERTFSLAQAPVPGWGPQAEAAALRGWEPPERLSTWNLATDNVDAAWGLLASAARRFLAARQGSVDVLRPEGINHGFVKQAFSPQVGREGEALTLSLAAQPRVIRQADGALLLWPPGLVVAPPESPGRWFQARERLCEER